MESAPRQHEEKVPTAGGASEQYIEAIFEHFITGSPVIGLGKDGIVFKVETQTLPDEEQRALIASGIMPDTDEEHIAAKILKVYNPGLGDQEYRMQQRAYDIVSQQEGGVYCSVPSIFGSTDQHITERTRIMLNQYGAHVEDHAEILVMDYINGKDLGTMMYDHVLTKLGYDGDSLAVMSYSEKEQEAGKAVGFEQPDLSSSSQEELDSARALTFARNEIKLLKYLKKDGFVLDPAILAAVENTIRLLHQNGLYHNDLHKQNVMIGEDGRVYLIDFGRADTQKREKSIDDSTLVQTWKPLTMTKEIERQQRVTQARKTFGDVAERMKKSPVYQEKLIKLSKDVATEGVAALEKALIRARSSDAALEHFFISLSILLDEDASQKDIFVSFIDSLTAGERKWRPADLNMIGRFRESGIWN